MKFSRIKFSLMLIAFCGSLLSGQSYAANYQYTAITQAPRATKQGMVHAGSLNWRCMGNRCTISGPWPTPGVGACKSLARQVGRLRSYGHPKKRLNAGQMAQCNAGIKAPNRLRANKPMATAKSVTHPANPKQAQKSKSSKPTMPAMGGFGAPTSGGSSKGIKSPTPTTMAAPTPGQGGFGFSPPPRAKIPITHPIHIGDNSHVMVPAIRVVGDPLHARNSQHSVTVPELRVVGDPTHARNAQHTVAVPGLRVVGDPLHARNAQRAVAVPSLRVVGPPLSKKNQLQIRSTNSINMTKPIQLK